VTDSWISFELDPPAAQERARSMADYGTSLGWLVAEIDGTVAGYGGPFWGPCFRQYAVCTMFHAFGLS
jgi:hypothetical protein